MSLKNKVLFVTGASRGIGLAIALRATRDGARIAVCAKTVSEDSRLPGTIYTAAKEIEAAGGQALAIQLDVRDEEQVRHAMQRTVEAFGGIDIVVNNAGAIQLSNTENTEMKRYDLMHSINARAVFMVTKYALPHLKQSSNAHVLNLSPPINLDPGWFAENVAYTVSKYGMSLYTLGMAREFKNYRIAVNSLWPETAIDTSAVRNLLGGEASVKRSRKADIMADAAHYIFEQDAGTFTGQFLLDGEVLKQSGVNDLSQYSCVPGNDLIPDFFIGAAPDKVKF